MVLKTHSVRSGDLRSDRWLLAVAHLPELLVPPSDLGPVVPPPGRAVGLWEARHVPDLRSDENREAEALDRRLEGALRSALTPLQAGVLRRRYWNGWDWVRIADYYWPESVRGLDRFLAVRTAEWTHRQALRILRGALR